MVIIGGTGEDLEVQREGPKGDDALLFKEGHSFLKPKENTLY